MNVAVIVIGDELLLGQVTDTNSGLLARRLAPYGWTVCRVTTVGDDPMAIRDAIARSFEAAQVVLTTGGLGPTKDDITKSVLCEYFGGTLRHDPEVLENVKRIFAHRNISMNRLTATQAEVPTSCRVIQNTVGTAPVMWFDSADGERTLVAMPGVPSETAVVFPEYVLPQLLAKYGGAVEARHCLLLNYGISESALAEHLDEYERTLPEGVHLAYLPVNGMIRLRLDCLAPTQEATDALLDEYSSRLKALVADWLVAERDCTPAEILVEALRSRSMTVATAESCTGGNIAHEITLISGCSDVMVGGVVAYSNDVKRRLLGVDTATLDAHGAVSEPVVKEMAEGVRAATGAALGISTSGIAGPGGGSAEKPVGTVCMAVSIEGVTITATHHFGGSRAQIIARATTAALMMAVDLLKNADNISANIK